MYRAASFEQKTLTHYTGPTQDSETSNISFESPIIELLKLIMNVGVAVLLRPSRPLE